MKRLSLLALLLIAACAPGAYQSSPDVSATVNGESVYVTDSFSIVASAANEGLGFSISNWTDSSLAFDASETTITYSDGRSEGVEVREQISYSDPSGVIIVGPNDSRPVVLLPDSSVSRSPMWGTRIVPPFVGAQPGTTATLDLVIATNGEPETVTVVYTVR